VDVSAGPKTIDEGNGVRVWEWYVVAAALLFAV
jgi:hypothetical protein